MDFQSISEIFVTKGGGWWYFLICIIFPQEHDGLIELKNF
jgi:hypothetical protein